MTPRSGETLAALFQDGEVRLVDTPDGWEGFRRDDEGGEPTYYYVDTRPHVPELRRDIRVGERAVRDTLQDRLEPVAADGGERQ